MLISFVTWHRAQSGDIRIGMWQTEGRLATADVNSIKHTTVSFCLDSLQGNGRYYLYTEPARDFTDVHTHIYIIEKCGEAESSEVKSLK